MFKNITSGIKQNLHWIQPWFLEWCYQHLNQRHPLAKVEYRPLLDQWTPSKTCDRLKWGFLSVDPEFLTAQTLHPFQGAGMLPVVHAWGDYSLHSAEKPTSFLLGLNTSDYTCLHLRVLSHRTFLLNTQTCASTSENGSFLHKGQSVSLLYEHVWFPHAGVEIGRGDTVQHSNEIHYYRVSKLNYVRLLDYQLRT